MRCSNRCRPSPASSKDGTRLPILSNVLIEREAEQLRLVATDLEIQILTRCTVAKGGTDESLTVSARKLQDILRSLPDEAKVALDAQNNRLQVKAGKSRFNLQTLPATDFPLLGDAGARARERELAQKVLKELLLLVQFSMAQQDIRYYLNGMLLVLEKRRDAGGRDRRSSLGLCERRRGARRTRNAK